MMKSLKNFGRNEHGMETVEYAVMTALIVVALIAAVTAFALALQGRLGGVNGIG